MALTISQIMPVVAAVLMNEMGKNYELTLIQQPADSNVYCTSLYDRLSGASVSILWSQLNDFSLTSEKMKIDFARALLENAVHTLDIFIEEWNNPKEDVQEVDFSE